MLLFWLNLPALLCISLFSRNFKENGSWPLLGEAVERNERIFVFIRDTVGVVGEDDLEFVREIKVKPAPAPDPAPAPAPAGEAWQRVPREQD